jgi:hypothetical protein
VRYHSASRATPLKRGSVGRSESLFSRFSEKQEYDVEHMRRIGLNVAALSLALLACNPSTSKLEKKARCATIGRAYVAKLEELNLGEPVIMNATFAYNSSSDSCLCRYEAHWTAKGAGAYSRIVDVLSNATLAYCDYTVFPSPQELKQYQAAASAMDQDQPIPRLPH